MPQLRKCRPMNKFEFARSDIHIKACLCTLLHYQSFPLWITVLFSHLYMAGYCSPNYHTVFGDFDTAVAELSAVVCLAMWLVC